MFDNFESEFYALINIRFSNMKIFDVYCTFFGIRRMAKLIERDN